MELLYQHLWRTNVTLEVAEPVAEESSLVMEGMIKRSKCGPSGKIL